MIYEHIFDCEHYKEGHITSKYSLIIFEELNLSSSFVVFRIL